MPPPLPSHHRGMTANPLKPNRYRPGKAIAEEPSSDEEEDGDDDAEQRQRELEERRRQEQLRRAAASRPKASSFPAGQSTVTKGVKVEEQEEQEEDEEGFVTEDEEEEEKDDNDEEGGRKAAVGLGSVAGDGVKGVTRVAARGVKIESEEESEEEEEEEDEEEESSDEESSSEEETPRRVLLRPTFIKKDKRNTNTNNLDTQKQQPDHVADSAAEAEARRAQRQEKADALVREQLEKDAIARSQANRAWDDDELEVGDEEAIDDTDGKDPEAEYAAWKLRELKRVKREREAIEAAEKEREEVERRRDLTAEEREREDREFVARQKEEKEASRGQAGYMQRYFHKGAFFRDDMEREGLDRRNAMGARFADDVSRETLPEYMQIRDMTKLGKKGRTRYKDLRSEDTGRFGDSVSNRFGRRNDAPLGVTDERFMPDERPRGPTGANASVVRERRRSRSRSRSHSPRRDRYGDRRERHRSRDRSADRYRPDAGGRRKRSPSPYDDREKRRRMEDATSH
ncbi:microfibrillar-associated 1 family protein [Aspergillus homomorphus CBS 101889]|uniref:Micro-fibrillar-associated protein 1 C-terminal domain-containing protein n=1 Tax=Aspergillus homomorphus (strain CBS 101889) TaxID=1450537 RepID=A0A395I908_ASPHC|nr:hypothetical protein BO97DRAFT_404157 [Aspergillus homomorphus CBS 101889]RAL14624.1 hypothetical protein BO97DRAFT_404157 [Aspergillus homomorphus CBS 101889]